MIRADSAAHTQEPDQESSPQRTPKPALETVISRLNELGPFARPVRLALRILIEAEITLPELVARTGLPRREVEQLLADLGEDITTGNGLIRLRAERTDHYRRQLSAADHDDRAPATLLEDRLSEHAQTVTRMRRMIEAAPPPERHYDHVPATAETTVRRALWLDSGYELQHARLLCIGDHDLTSLATAMVNEKVSITVVDIDERTLEYINQNARRYGWDIRCHWADFRFGLPRSTRNSADLVFTDPPYTPEGVQLFLLRALQGLSDAQRGRILMAYGYGDHQPGLGLKVQEAVQSMHLAFEAILPGFNRYHGAQAIGSRSDLYVCRPTPRTWRALPRIAAQVDPRIYTHGELSLEARTDAIATAAVDALISPLRRAAATNAQDGRTQPRLLLVGRRWATRPDPPEVAEQFESVERILLNVLLDHHPASPDALMVAADLADDPGPWLLRVLLASNAQTLTALVPNAHPDISSEAALTSLRTLIDAKYSVHVRRNTPDSRYSVVETRATAAMDSTDSADRMLGQYLLLRSRTKIGPVWRDALVSLNRRRNRVLSKNQARALVQEHSPAEHLLEVSLLELPRHQIAEVLNSVRSSAQQALALGADRA